jgi:hypothetical protein
VHSAFGPTPNHTPDDQERDEVDVEVHMLLAAGAVNLSAITQASWFVPALIAFILGYIARGKIG